MKNEQKEDIKEKSQLEKDIEQISIHKDVEKKVREDLGQDQEKEEKKKIEVPMCNYGPGCRCNPEIKEDMFDLIEAGKQPEVHGEESKKKKKKKNLKTAFEYNLKVDFHDANSNFYQLLSSEEEDCTVIEEEESEEESSDNSHCDQMTNEEKAETIVEEENETSDDSFITEYSDVEEVDTINIENTKQTESIAEESINAEDSPDPEEEKVASVDMTEYFIVNSRREETLRNDESNCADEGIKNEPNSEEVLPSKGEESDASEIVEKNTKDAIIESINEALENVSEYKQTVFGERNQSNHDVSSIAIAIHDIATVESTEEIPDEKEEKISVHKDIEVDSFVFVEKDMPKNENVLFTKVQKHKKTDEKQGPVTPISLRKICEDSGGNSSEMELYKPLVEENKTKMNSKYTSNKEDSILEEKKKVKLDSKLSSKGEEKDTNNVDLSSKYQYTNQKQEKSKKDRKPTHLKSKYVSPKQERSTENMSKANFHKMASLPNQREDISIKYYDRYKKPPQKSEKVVEAKVTANFAKSNCRDIMNLLQQESSMDLDLHPDWNRATTSPFPLENRSRPSSSTGRPSPLPPIVSMRDVKNRRETNRVEKINPPNWKRVPVENIIDHFDHEDDHEEVSDQNDKWLRSSTPANTLPSLLRNGNGY